MFGLGVPGPGVQGAAGSAAAVIKAGGGAPAPSTDDYWDNVVLYSRFDGTDASTTFVDETGLKTITAAGAAELDTADKVFGTASLKPGGIADGNYASVDAGTELVFGTGDFTIECRFKVAAYGVDHNDAGQSIMDGRAGLTATPWAIETMGPNHVTASWRNEVHIYNGASHLSSGANVVAGTWYAFAWTRTGGTSYIFIDGVDVGQFADSVDYTNGNNVVRIGDNIDSIAATNGAHTGWIDEFRVTKDVARYTSNYTIATEQFPTTQT
jgi:hypothetical protein